MAGPHELSLEEIRNFMVRNGGKVTNLELVKYFKKFLTNPVTQDEARKHFKTYVNTLSTIKNEGKEKYIILRKKYYNESPIEEFEDNLNTLLQTDVLMSPGSRSTISEHENLSFTGSQSFLSDISPMDSPYREPPPYKPPPEVVKPIGPVATETQEQYRECVDEFRSALEVFGVSRRDSESSDNRNKQADIVPVVPPRKRNSCEKFNEIDDRRNDDKENSDVHKSSRGNILEKQISVKEATQKFNQIASEEEAKFTSPTSKKKPEKKSEEMSNDNLLSSHPKSKEWLVSAARASYQELAKLSSEHPELVKLQDPTTTALHWAAKHGNEDIVKLIAGTHKANVNTRTNGGYTPLHLAMQFGKDNIFELLCNVYKADRDILDWSGKKPLDYRKIRTTVSASTYSKIKARKKHSEKDLGFLRIGSLNVRVKKTTEAFSNFLGVGNNQHRIPTYVRTSAPPSATYFDKVHKTWGSADNIPQCKKLETTDSTTTSMPPPKMHSIKKRRSKRSNDYSSGGGYRSVPTTPNQPRANSIGTVSEHPKTESDSDSACGFDANWKDSDVVHKPSYI